MSTIEIILLKNDLHKAIWTGDGIVPLLHSFINKTTHAHFIYETRGVTIKIQEYFIVNIPIHLQLNGGHPVKAVPLSRYTTTQ